MNDPWRNWIDDPPHRRYERVEIVRVRMGESPGDCRDEPAVITVDAQRPEWNVAGIYWRPFY